MSQCHGFWSIGAVAAVLAGGWLAKAGISVLHQSMGAAVLLAAGAALLAVFLPPDPREPAASLADTMTVLPPWSLLPLCLLPVGIMIVEGVVMDWSAVYMREILDADPFSAALGFASFSAAMAVVRLSGDALAARFGDRPVVVLSSIAAGAGTAVFAFAGSVAGAVVGAAVCGAGIATVYPIALSAAARAPGPAERNIAAVSFTSFLVLLGSPAAFGFAAEELGYRLALGLCATLALPTVVLSKALQSSLAAAHAKPSTGQ